MQHYRREESHIWFTTPSPIRKRLDISKSPGKRGWGVGCGSNRKDIYHQLLPVIYLLANFWWDILVGKPDLDIRTTSSTPQHLSCCSTSPCSYDSGDWRLLGLMQRIKCGVVLSKRCISWNNWPCMPMEEKIDNLSFYSILYHAILHKINFFTSVSFPTSDNLNQVTYNIYLV
jgi:hypothetical protein